MTDTPGTPDDLVPDLVPDVDRAEQEQDAIRPDTYTAPISIPMDVPEADALEQALPGPLDDEDDVPR